MRVSRNDAKMQFRIIIFERMFARKICENNMVKVLFAVLENSRLSEKCVQIPYERRTCPRFSVYNKIPLVSKCPRFLFIQIKREDSKIDYLKKN